MAKHRITDIEAIETDWTDIILVCRACGKTGFGDDRKDPVSRLLKRELRARGQRRRIGIAEVDCLGLCPKHAVTIVLASRPGRLIAVPHGQPGAAILAGLGFPDPPPKR
jgi:predicted metal-binding protein